MKLPQQAQELRSLDALFSSSAKCIRHCAYAQRLEYDAAGMQLLLLAGEQQKDRYQLCIMAMRWALCIGITSVL